MQAKSVASRCCMATAPSVALAKTCSAASALSSCLLNCRAAHFVRSSQSGPGRCVGATSQPAVPCLGTGPGSSQVHATAELCSWRDDAMPRVSAADAYRLDFVERPLQPLRVVGALKAGKQPDACRMRENRHCLIARSRGDPPCVRTHAMLVTMRRGHFRMRPSQH
jgi:hypothetical protein